jgi:hypothetical protein
MKWLLVAELWALSALAACNPTLTVQSPQPPGRIARVDPVEGFWGTTHYRAELSQGVAIALTCSRGAPCEHMRVVSDDPAIAEVRPASLAVLEHSWDGEQTAAALVIVGKSPGTTTIRVSAEQGARRITVRVVPPPAPANSLAATSPEIPSSPDRRRAISGT